MTYVKTKLNVKTSAKRMRGTNPNVSRIHLYHPIVKNTPIDSIKRLFSYLIDKYTHEFEFKSGYFADILFEENRDVNTPSGRSVKDLIERLKQPFIESLREAREAGDINASIDVEELTESIWNSFECALMHMNTSRSVEPLYAFQYKVFEVLLKE